MVRNYRHTKLQRHRVCFPHTLTPKQKPFRRHELGRIRCFLYALLWVPNLPWESFLPKLERRLPGRMLLRFLWKQFRSKFDVSMQ